MKVTCNVCHTTKTIKEEKLEPYRGKTISTKCANKQCKNRIKFKVPLHSDEKPEPEIAKTKPVQKKEQKPKEIRSEKASNPIIEKDKQLYCPNCHAEITEETNFCMECGHKIAKQPTPIKLEVKKCVNCGRVYGEDEKFCLECGTPKELKSAKFDKKPTSKSETKSKPEPIPIPKPKAKPKTKSNIDLNPKQSSQNTEEEASVKKETIALKSTPQPIQQKKKKSGCFTILWKVALAIIVLISVAVVAIVVLDDSKDYKLANGPWEVTASLSQEFYKGNRVNNTKLKEAVALANAEYASTFNASSINAPISEDYAPSPEDFLLDQYHPNKKDDFYLFTIKDVDAKGGELRVILQLKSDDYFEGKAFYFSKREVSVGYLKGNLKK